MRVCKRAKQSFSWWPAFWCVVIFWICLFLFRSFEGGYWIDGNETGLGSFLCYSWREKERDERERERKRERERGGGEEGEGESGNVLGFENSVKWGNTKLIVFTGFLVGQMMGRAVGSFFFSYGPRVVTPELIIHNFFFFFDSLCFFEWTWPSWNPWKAFREETVWFKQRKACSKVAPFLLVRLLSGLARNRHVGKIQLKWVNHTRLCWRTIDAPSTWRFR